MIATERGYQRTKALIQGIEEVIARQEVDLAGMHPLLAELTRAGQAGLLAEWREEIAEFEALRDGRLRLLRLDSLPELGPVLRQARLAAGLTQAALAERAGLAPEQVTSYEATDYREAPVAHCQAIIEALGAKVSVEALIAVHSPSAPADSPAAAPASR